MENVQKKILEGFQTLKYVSSVCAGKILMMSVDKNMFEAIRHVFDKKTFVNGKDVIEPCLDEDIKLMDIVIEGPEGESKKPIIMMFCSYCQILENDDGEHVRGAICTNCAEGTYMRVEIKEVKE